MVIKIILQESSLEGFPCFFRVRRTRACGPQDFSHSQDRSARRELKKAILLSFRLTVSSTVHCVPSCFKCKL